jgi:replicative DNA helicase
VKLDEEYDPPRAVEAEEALLGSMTWGLDAIRDAAAAGVRPSDFTSAAREQIYLALVALATGEAPIELPALLLELRRRGQEQRVGGALELVRLADRVPGAASAAYYAGIVRRMARRRTIMEAALRLFRRAADLTVPDEELEDETEEGT